MSKKEYIQHSGLSPEVAGALAILTQLASKTHQEVLNSLSVLPTSEPKATEPETIVPEDRLTINEIVREIRKSVHAIKVNFLDRKHALGAHIKVILTDGDTVFVIMVRSKAKNSEFFKRFNEKHVRDTSKSAMELKTKKLIVINTGDQEHDILAAFEFFLKRIKPVLFKKKPSDKITSDAD